MWPLCRNAGISYARSSAMTTAASDAVRGFRMRTSPMARLRLLLFLFLLFLLFFWPLPAFERHLLAARQRELAVGRVLGDGAARARGGVLADAHRRHQHVAGTDESAVFD